MANEWPADGTTSWNAVMKTHLEVEHNTNGTHNIPDATVQAGVSGSATAGLFGAWTNQDTVAGTLGAGNTYLAQCDGFVVLNYDSGSDTVIQGLTDSASPPTTVRSWLATSGLSDKKVTFTMPVRKGEYWKVTASVGTPTIFWLPFGTGGSVKQ